MEVQGAISPKQLRDPCCYCHQHKDRTRPLKRDWKKALSLTDSRALYRCLENIPGCQSVSGMVHLGFAAPLPQCSSQTALQAESLQMPLLLAGMGSPGRQTSGATWQLGWPWL